MPAVILHEFGLGAESYAVRLLAALLDVPLTLRRVDVYPGREHEREAFLALNPLGSVPVLVDGGRTLRDWRAIMVHLARHHDASARWSPPDVAATIEWLGFAGALGRSAGLARLHDGMGFKADIARCRHDAHQLLRVLERHLWFGEREGCAWLLPGNHPTVADIAVFVHAALCEEGGIERLDYPAVRRWIDRVRFLDGFVPTSGLFAPPPATGAAA